MPTGNKNPATGEQRGGMCIAPRCHAAGGGEGTAHGIVELSAVQRDPLRDPTPCLPTGYQDLAIGEQRCAVSTSRRSHATGYNEDAGSWIVNLSAVQITQICLMTGSDENLTVGEQRGGMCMALRYHAAG